MGERNFQKEYMFQLTLPERGATREHLPLGWLRGRFNPRSPSGERHGNYLLETESTWFRLTLPERGATGCLQDAQRIPLVSTHAPRAGSDRNEIGKPPRV